MTKDEALAKLFENIDQAIAEALCSKSANFSRTMVGNNFRIPEKVTLHAPERLKDTIIEHYKKNGFRVIDCGRENRDTYIYIIQIGW